jgi:hypothetical protein
MTPHCEKVIRDALTKITHFIKLSLSLKAKYF